MSKTAKALIVLFLVAAVGVTIRAQQTINGTRTIAGNLTVSGTCTGCGGAAGMTLIQQHTVSGASSIAFPSTDTPPCISSTYDSYLIKVEHAVPATNAQQLELQISTDGTTYIAGSSYAWTDFRYVSGGSGNGGTNAGSFFGVASPDSAIANDAHYGWSGQIFIDSTSSTSAYKTFSAAGSYGATSSTRAGNVVGGFWESTTAILGLQILYGSGMISGTARCYGLAK